MNIKDFKHCTKIQIRYKDVDKMGHVNNANHITYFETARIEYYKSIFKTPIDWEKTGMILAHTEIDYFEPVFLEDEVNCYTKITNVGNKSFEISNILAKNNDSVICAEGKSIIVCMNYLIKQTIEIPESWKEDINHFERK